MSTCESVKIHVHCSDGLSEKLEAIHDRITRRAYERWLNRRVPGQTMVEFWSAAERELFCQPKTEIRDWAHGFTVEIACSDVQVGSLRVFMSRTELLVLAPLQTSSLDLWIFRYLRFPKPVDNADASAFFEKGALQISATCVDAPEEQKVHFRVA